MNERLTVLLETAKDLALHVYRNVDDDVSYELLVNEIFAELIIKDSEASILESFKSYSDGTNVSDYSEGYVNGMKDAIQLIKEHFGVKS